MLAAQEGIVPVIGGLPFDSGLALGVEYRKPELVGYWLDFGAKAIASTKKYEFLEVRLAAPRLAGKRLFAETEFRYRNFPEDDFWGIGHKSARESRTTFRLEDFTALGSFGVRPVRWLEAGVTGGMLKVNTGPGKDKDRPSIEERFTAADTPALDRQPDYFLSGAFVRADSRDHPAHPHSGGWYELRWTRFHDRDLGRHQFHRFRADLRHFLPSFREEDVLALRAVAVVSERGAGRSVPFFLQPTVGGGGDLRGYHQYRFRDENALAFNLEYRWRAREMFHAVGFADAGRVFSRPGEMGLRGLRGSLGAGGRLKIGNFFLLGADLGWSPDGFRFWFRGAHSF